jgi:O-antigen ligase
VATYAAAFIAGLWICLLAGRRMMLMLLPLAGAGIFAGIWTLFEIGFGDNAPLYLHEDGTLRFPIGYRNANALFFLLGIWSALSYASLPKVDWRIRAALISGSTLMLNLVILSQSRGSIPGAGISLIVFLALTPVRPRGAISFVLAIIPVIPFIATLLDPFQNGTQDASAVPLLHNAAVAAALSTVFSAVLACLWLGVVRPRLDISAQFAKRAAIATAITCTIAVVGVSTAFMVKEGGPVALVNQKVEEFGKVGYPSFDDVGTRYGSNVGSNRSDFWRVSLDQLRDDPITGGGAGSFRFAYLQDRRSEEGPEDPHSVEMSLLGELGLPGLLLFALMIGAGVIAALRSRRLGPFAATVTSGALACLAAWVMQSSYDWFWQYPGVTAPVFGLLGAAVAPGLLTIGQSRARRLRIASAVAVVLVLAVSVPIFIASRYESQGLKLAASDPEGALHDLRLAGDINIFSPSPGLAEGVLAMRLGDEGRAEKALLESLHRQPENYAAPYYLASLLATEEPVRALGYATLARRLNPDDPAIKDLELRLQKAMDSPG